MQDPFRLEKQNFPRICSIVTEHRCDLVGPAPGGRWKVDGARRFLTAVGAPLAEQVVADVGDRAPQLCPEVGVGDGDQCLGALAERLADEVHGAVLGDDVVDVSARGDHPGPRLQGGDDAGDGAFGRRRRKGKDRLPPFERAAPRMKSICPPMPE